jgi:trans-aconitate methyltransferase
VLDIASGPARDVFEYLCCESSGRVVFDCVDMDKNAIEFAGSLCASFPDNVNFIKANAFRFRCSQKYDLIWSAGLFDYLNDRQFLFMLQRYLPCLKAGGSMVVGNFTTNNPTRPYMEVVTDWCLCHRDENELMELADQAGVQHNNVSVGSEPEKLNLFLHMQK